MTRALLDDHLLRDLLTDQPGASLQRLLRQHEPATTNLYYLRLCRSVASGRGSQLTGSWSPERRRALGRTLTELPDGIAVVPIRTIAFAMAELANAHRLSTLGSEAVAAAIQLDAPLCVWSGDDGPNIRAASRTTGVRYRTMDA